MGTIVPKAIAAAVLNSLKGGVVPRVGLEYITVGRKNEINALLNDVDIIEQGGSTFRFVVGKYGSGKTFLMHALRNHVMERGFVVTDAELTNEKRLVGNKGQGLATYRELIHNMAIHAKPDNEALPLVLEKWISRIQNEVVQNDGIAPDADHFKEAVSRKIYDVTTSMEQQINGFEFGRVLDLYYKAYIAGDEAMMKKTFKWFRGEYKTKTEAKNDLEVNLIVTDDNWYEFMKLFSCFVAKAGFKGLYLCIDELPNLYRIPSKVGRDYNYNKILYMYNDALQGNSKYMGIIMGNTPEGMEDPVKGVFSYEALATRLQDSKFAKKNADLSAPVIHLVALNPAELYILVEKLTYMHADLYAYEARLEHDDFIHFLKSEYARMERVEDITVRDIIRNYISFLNLVQQNPDTPVSELALLEKV